MNNLQRKLNTIIEIYKELYPEEYKAVIEQIKVTRENSVNEFAEAESESLGRALFELPEVLYNLINLKLTPEESKEFSSKKESREFARRHPEFCIPDKI